MQKNGYRTQNSAFFKNWSSRAYFGHFKKISGFLTETLCLEGRIWDLIVSVPDHCLSFYSDKVSMIRERNMFVDRNKRRKLYAVLLNRDIYLSPRAACV